MKTKYATIVILSLLSVTIVACAPTAPVYERNENHLPTSTLTAASSESLVLTPSITETDPQTFESGNQPSFTESENTPSSNESETSTAVNTPTPDPIRADFHNVMGNTTNSIHKLFASDTDTVVYDDCIYFVSGGTIKKYNLKTGKCTSACADPACTHRDASCPLYSADVLKIDHIDDDVIYWAERGTLYKTNTDYYAYNMKTFEKKVVFSVLTTGGVGLYHADYGDYMYFKYPVLKEGADGSKRDDYEMKIVEVNKKTGEQRTAFDLENPEDMIVTMLDDGRIIMNGEGYYYTINRDGTNKHQFSRNTIDLTFSYIVGNGINKIYTCRLAGEDESIYPGGLTSAKIEWEDENGKHGFQTGIPLSDGCKYCNIVSIDIDTGEVTTVVSEKTGQSFFITDDYLYFFGYDYHMLEGEHAFGPRSTWGDFRAPRAVWMSGELFRLDLKTGKKTLVRDDYGMYFIGDTIIIGDYTLMWIETVYDFKSNTFNYDDYMQYILYDMVNNTYEVVRELKN